jgi:hypothetical protein
VSAKFGARVRIVSYRHRESAEVIRRCAHWRCRHDRRSLLVPNRGLQDERPASHVSDWRGRRRRRASRDGVLERHGQGRADRPLRDAGISIRRAGSAIRPRSRTSSRHWVLVDRRDRLYNQSVLRLGGPFMRRLCRKGLHHVEMAGVAHGGGAARWAKGTVYARDADFAAGPARPPARGHLHLRPSVL